MAIKALRIEVTQTGHAYAQTQKWVLNLCIEHLDILAFYQHAIYVQFSTPEQLKVSTTKWKSMFLQDIR